MANQNNPQFVQNQLPLVVVMVPFPAQGHLNQLLHLSRIISSYDIPIHYVSSTVHSRQVKLRVHGWDPLAPTAGINFHEFPTLFLTPPPNTNTVTNFPSHLQPSFDASYHLREPVANLIRILSPTARRIIVINDSLMASVVQDVISIPNAEAYTFRSVSAFYLFWNWWEKTGKPIPVDEEILKELPSMEDCVTTEFKEFMQSQAPYRNFRCGYIYNTSKVIEGQYLDLLARETIRGNTKQWAIGPFNPLRINANKNSIEQHECLKWLDKQDPNTVLFVSFGTTISLSDKQIQELACGLERSEQNFIWVLREADKGDVFVGDDRIVELPNGYEQRVGGRGAVVRDWAPQLEILEHPSIGGFMSHCGWNSCIESITMGVPIAAWPMHTDQPRNAMLITNVLKTGTLVRDWACRGELVTSKTIEEVVRRLMESKEGAEIRNRAAELGREVRRSVEEGGVTRMELDSFAAHISR